LNSGVLTADELLLKSNRFETILQELEAKGDRWLELSERRET